MYSWYSYTTRWHGLIANQRIIRGPNDLACMRPIALKHVEQPISSAIVGFHASWQNFGMRGNLRLRQVSLGSLLEWPQLTNHNLTTNNPGSSAFLKRERGGGRLHQASRTFEMSLLDGRPVGEEQEGECHPAIPSSKAMLTTTKLFWGWGTFCYSGYWKTRHLHELLRAEWIASHLSCCPISAPLSWNTVSVSEVSSLWHELCNIWARRGTVAEEIKADSHMPSNVCREMPCRCSITYKLSSMVLHA